MPLPLECWENKPFFVLMTTTHFHFYPKFLIPKTDDAYHLLCCMNTVIRAAEELDRMIYLFFHVTMCQRKARFFPFFHLGIVLKTCIACFCAHCYTATVTSVYVGSNLGMTEPQVTRI